MVPDTDLRGGTYPAVVVQRLEALKLEARASNIRYCFDSSAPRSRWRRGLVAILIFWLTDSGVRGRFLGPCHSLPMYLARCLSRVPYPGK